MRSGTAAAPWRATCGATAPCSVVTWATTWPVRPSGRWWDCCACTPCSSLRSPASRSRCFFEAWLAQLANYALITILTVLIAALLLQVVESYADQTAARGAAIVTVDALNMVLIAVLVFLLMRQVMPIAAALAGGVAPNTFHLVSRVASWSVRRGAAAARDA